MEIYILLLNQWCNMDHHNNQWCRCRPLSCTGCHCAFHPLSPLGYDSCCLFRMFGCILQMTTNCSTHNSLQGLHFVLSGIKNINKNWYEKKILAWAGFFIAGFFFDLAIRIRRTLFAAILSQLWYELCGSPDSSIAGLVTSGPRCWQIFAVDY